MKILRERPSQRLHHRVTTPLRVTWRDATVRAADWSLSGLRVEGASTAGLPAIVLFDRRSAIGALDGIFAQVGGWYSTTAQAGEPSE